MIYDMYLYDFISYSLSYLILILFILQPFLDIKLVSDRILEVVKNYEKVNSGANVTINSRFKEDLNLDSLDAGEYTMYQYIYRCIYKQRYIYTNIMNVLYIQWKQ